MNIQNSAYEQTKLKKKKKKKKIILVKEMTIQLVLYFINHISLKKISYRFKKTIST